MNDAVIRDVFVGIGSNIDPERNLLEALAALSAAFGSCRTSSVYRSPPYGFVGADFLNMVAGFRTRMSPEAVEQRLSAIEYSGGRERNASKFAARTLDLDLLIYGQAVEPALRLPREDVLLYPFVLAPLAEIAPTLRHPLTGQTMQSAWASMSATDPAIVTIGPRDCLGDKLPADAAASVDG